MRYQLVIFDFDGTLADSLPWMMGVANQIADRHHFQRPTPEDLEALRGPEGASFTKLLKIPRWKLPLIARDGRRLMSENLAQIRLFPEIGAMLRRLVDHGVKLAMVSSNSEKNVRQVLGPELAPLMAAYECGASFFGKYRKFKRAIKQCGVAQENVLSVGDELRDLTASQQLGVPFGAVSWGFCRPEALKAGGASFVFQSVQEIVDLVLE